MNPPKTITKTLALLFIWGFVCANNARADIGWTNRFRFPTNTVFNNNNPNKLVVDSSGNVFVAGYSYLSGTDSDYFILKYSNSGVALWTNRYNGPINGQEYCNAITLDLNGDICVTGLSQNPVFTVGDYATVKYSNAGPPVWTNRYDGGTGGGDTGVAICTDNNRNVFVTGEANNPVGGFNFATIKYSAAGVPQWTNLYNGPGSGEDLANSIVVDGAGNVYVAGYSLGSGTGSDFAIIKYSNGGVPLWTNRYNGPGNSTDQPKAMAIDAAGNIYVTGFSRGTSSAGSEDYLTIAYSSAGTPLWTNRYNGPGNNDDEASAIVLDANANVYVTGKSYNATTSTSADFATIKYSSSGVPLWTNRYDGLANSADFANAIAVDPAGNIFVTGPSVTAPGSFPGSGWDFTTIAYSSAGVPLRTNYYNGTGNDSDIPNSIVIDSNGNVFITGSSIGSSSIADFVTIKYPALEQVFVSSILHISKTTSNAAVVAWGAPSTGFGLQGSDDLPNTNWFAITNAVNVVAGENQVTVPLEQARYYRLIQWGTPATNASAGFSSGPNPAACHQTINFDATASIPSGPGRTISTYSWDFGDGTTGSGKQVGHAYNFYGTFNVVLTVMDNNVPPNIASKSQSIFVNQGNQPPTASTGGPYIADLGTGIGFDGSLSSDPNISCGDSIASYSWQIGNNVYSLTGATPNLSPLQVNALGIGIFNVSLTVSDTFGSTNTATTSLAIYDNKPVASFTASPNPAACSQTVSFDGSASTAGRPDRNIVGYSWDFGDGQNASGKQTTHAYSHYGSFVATLIVLDDNIPPKTATNTVFINVNQGNQPPIASSGGPYTADLGTNVLFDASASSDPNLSCGDSISYSWNVANGAIFLTGATPSLTTQQVSSLGAGSYNLALTVSDSFGAIGTANTTLTIYDNRPVASFTASPNPAACSQTVSFNASASTAGRPDRNIVGYSWDFGDGQTASGKQTAHAYSRYGAFVATLIVLDDNNPPKTATNTVLINVNQGNQPPIASSGGPYTADLGTGVLFDGSASSDPNSACGDSISYSWSIANGALTLADATPSLTAQQVNSLGAGIYNVGLTVSDSFGAIGTANTTLTIYDNRPVASFTASPNPAACSQTVSFNASASTAGRPDRNIVGYSWDFGDGQIGSGQQVTHSFSAFGNYTVKLIILDDGNPGKTGTNSVLIQVNQGNQPPIAATSGPYLAQLGNGVVFDGSTSSDPNIACGDSLFFSWDVANGTFILSAAKPALTASQINALGVGTYNVVLTVTDSFGAFATANTTLQIQP